jgi:hypothetical protein
VRNDKWCLSSFFITFVIYLQVHVRAVSQQRGFANASRQGPPREAMEMSYKHAGVNKFSNFHIQWEFILMFVNSKWILITLIRLDVAFFSWIRGCCKIG